MMEKALLDLTPDSAVEMNKRKKLLRWDAKKRKFVKQTLDEMSAAKKIRTEVGGSLKSSRPQGEMYEKWKKKQRREISSGGFLSEDGPSSSEGPKFRHNTKVKSELRGAGEIKKLHQKREADRMKNMKKGKRDSIQGKKKGGKKFGKVGGK